MPQTKVSTESGVEALRSDLTVLQQPKCTLERSIKRNVAQVRILTLGCSQFVRKTRGFAYSNDR